jgi:hypothetical protein
LTDGDCPDPNNKVCDPSSNLCLPCRASIDCECSADGPICSDYDQYSAGYGACTCMGDGNCMAHIGGPRCVGNGSHFKECG